MIRTMYEELLLEHDPKSLTPPQAFKHHLTPYPFMPRNMHHFSYIIWSTLLLLVPKINKISIILHYI